VKRVRPFRDDLGFEVPEKDLFRELKVPENGGMKGPEDALVDEAEVVVAPLDHGGLGFVTNPLHHDRVGLEEQSFFKFST